MNTTACLVGGAIIAVIFICILVWSLCRVSARADYQAELMRRMNDATRDQDD